MESTGEHYRCDKCGWTWDHEDDACPNCGSSLYILSRDEPINLQKLQNGGEANELGYFEHIKEE